MKTPNSVAMEFTKPELKRLFAYFDEGIDDWMEYHQQHEGVYEIDAGLKARFEDALYQMTPIEE